ncbi:MAG: DUF1573 domain-containing protein [Candidatus Latescibacterota bacterium]|nr:MAG: DUF1573 domain-containing protein [Candidatus Latescibacterota bacterium]
MKKLVGGLTLAVVISLLLITVAAATDKKAGTDTTADKDGQPAIVIEQMRHDMGEIFEQDKYRHVFKVKNDGDADLVIKSVKPG